MFERVDKTLNSRSPLTVNGKNTSLTTVNSTKQLTVDEMIGFYNAKPDYFAEILAKELGDLKSLSYYRILAKENRPEKLLEALSFTKQAAGDNKIRITKPVYYQGILRKWGIKTKFKKV